MKEEGDVDWEEKLEDDETDKEVYMCNAFFPLTEPFGELMCVSNSFVESLIFEFLVDSALDKSLVKETFLTETSDTGIKESVSPGWFLTGDKVEEKLFNIIFSEK